MAGDLNVLLAVAAGLLSFLSPCVLPLIPSYLSFIGGVSLSDLQDSGVRRGPVVLRTLSFVLGFTVVFVALGVVFSGSVFLLGGGTSQLLNYAAGAVVIVLGLNVMFDFWRSLNFERRFHVTAAPRGYLGSGLVGMAFGAGWTPCIGPILAGILALAGQSGEAARGALLLGAFSFGLGIPFLLAGSFFPAFLRWLGRVKPHFSTIRTASGLFLIGIGVLIALGRLQTLNGQLIRLGTDLARWHEANPGSSRILFAVLAAAIAAAPVLWGLRRRRARGGDTAIFGRFGTVVTAVAGVAAVLQLAGVLDLALVFAEWFRFQGI